MKMQSHSAFTCHEALEYHGHQWQANFKCKYIQTSNKDKQYNTKMDSSFAFSSSYTNGVKVISLVRLIVPVYKLASSLRKLFTFKLKLSS